MINFPINELLEKVENRYTLCAVISKRARQLVDGDNQLVEPNSKKPVSIAVEEFSQGKLTYIHPKSDIK
jgi:DNA-directed RNA polymerase subunit omega